MLTGIIKALNPLQANENKEEEEKMKLTPSLMERKHHKQYHSLSSAPKVGRDQQRPKIFQAGVKINHSSGAPDNLRKNAGHVQNQIIFMKGNCSRYQNASLYKTDFLKEMKKSQKFIRILSRLKWTPH